MTSWVDIGNLALSMLGDYNFITSLDDGTKASTSIKRNYEQVRDHCLRRHTWGFAKKRVQLAPSTSTPAFGGSSYFSKPTDFIRVVSINDDPREIYSIEGEYIRYDSSTLNLCYVSRVEDPNQYDSLFVDLLVARLAMVISANLKDSSTDKKVLQDNYDKALQIARTVDGRDAVGWEEQVSDDLIVQGL